MKSLACRFAHQPSPPITEHALFHQRRNEAGGSPARRTRCGVRAVPVAAEHAYHGWHYTRALHPMVAVRHPMVAAGRAARLHVEEPGLLVVVERLLLLGSTPARASNTHCETPSEHPV